MGDMSNWAIKQSLATKWIPIVQGNHANMGVSDCPLCKLYFKQKLCTDCPVHIHTGEHYCLGTPVHIFEDLHKYANSPEYFDLWPEVTAAAQMEVDFLRKLLNGNEDWL